MNLKGFDKVIVTNRFDEIRRGKVIGIKSEPDNSTSYLLMPLGVNFQPLKNGSSIMKINTKDIDRKEIIIKKHKSIIV